MYFRKCEIFHLESALHHINAEYKDNIIFQNKPEKTSHGIKATLRVRDSHAYGARTSWQGRHGPYASWEAHRDFIRALFKLVPNASVKTGMALYRGNEDFEAKFQETASKNVGSQIQPCTMPELSVYP